MGIEGHKLLCTEVKEMVLKSCLKMKLNPKTFAACHYSDCYYISN